ncbi:GNAT family N-acetyltransferase [Paenibacillus nasutitermitis]|uniref:GNAT family N-acetyltransferase n=1 Tax=Paenibacillus nasutitermitis TaxID=1652958 RepID=A0A916YYR4_9BACL|nr:GNAT family N-acetyltransferase [Paenibacillus nasutitermitis]GGD67525.1 GNAT family N-acetyltransferase [Paenibacillus nasutitermitis]
MEIRLLNREDAHRYRELRLKSLMENPEAYLTTYEIESAKPIEQVQQNLLPTDSRFTLGAFIVNELVGIVTFVRESNPKTLHKGNIYAMYVSPECRGKGTGKALIRRLIKRAAHLGGLEQINLSVISTNTGAIRLYERSGFTGYGTERNALKSGDHYWDEELMVLRLGERDKS